MSTGLLDEIAHALLGAGPDPHRAALQCAARCLAAASVDVLLGGAAHPALSELAALVGPVDHLGFIAPPTGDEALADAARAAGFERRQWTFPSTVLALELGARLGRGRMPTRVFKALGAAGQVEVFMPAEAPPEVLRQWIAGGIGSHLALPLLNALDFGRAAALLVSAGFVRPPGLGAEPVGNPSEQVLVTYFDGALGGHPMRLELCHPMSP